MKLVVNPADVNGEKLKIRNLRDWSFYPENHVFDLVKLQGEEKIRALRLFKMGDLVEKTERKKTLKAEG